jgi:pilus assembly protein CpaB
MPRLRRPRSPVHTARRVAAVLLAAAALFLALRPAGAPAAARPPTAVPDAGPLVGRVLAGGVRAGEPLTDARLVGPGLTALLPADLVAAPVRLADLAVAALVRTGDRVDVLAALPDGEEAERVAAGVLVLAAPGPASADPDPAAGLLVLAVDPATAARLAAASTTATLTVSLPPP